MKSWLAADNRFELLVPAAALAPSTSCAAEEVVLFRLTGYRRFGITQADATDRFLISFDSLNTALAQAVNSSTSSVLLTSHTLTVAAAAVAGPGSLDADAVSSGAAVKVQPGSAVLAFPVDSSDGITPEFVGAAIAAIEAAAETVMPVFFDEAFKCACGF